MGSPELHEVLCIEDGEVKPRQSVKEIFGEGFDGLRPKMSFVDYERYCAKVGKPPSLDEWERLHWLEHDEGPGAA